MSPKDFLEGEITRKHLAAAEPSRPGGGSGRPDAPCNTVGGTSDICHPGGKPGKIEPGKTPPPVSKPGKPPVSKPPGRQK